MAARDYGTAIAIVEERAEALYNQRLDQVLYHFDIAMLYHFDQQYAASNQHLEEAERLIEEYYTKSISQAVGSVLLNDRVIEYPGEDFEDVYVNIIKALNYIALGNGEAAFVEIRRANNKISFLKTKYNQAQAAVQQSEHAERATDIPRTVAERRFTASSLAHFLSMLLYTQDGEIDEALIDYNAMQGLFQADDSIYDFAFPSIIAPPTGISPPTVGAAERIRLSIVALAGPGPRKQSESLLLPPNIHIAIPTMHRQESAVKRVVLVDGGGAQIADLDLLEAIDDIALNTFEQRRQLIYAKTVIRAVTKGLVTYGADVALEEAGVPVLGDILRLFAVLSEQADVRTTRYIPAKAYVYDGFVVPARILGASVHFVDSAGVVLCRQVLSVGDVLPATAESVASTADAVPATAESIVPVFVLPAVSGDVVPEVPVDGVPAPSVPRAPITATFDRLHIESAVCIR